MNNFWGTTLMRRFANRIHYISIRDPFIKRVSKFYIGPLTTKIFLLSSLHQLIIKLVTNLYIVRDNIFKMVLLNLFFVIWTNLLNSNIFHNHIYIYYRDNHKCNIYNFCRTKMKTIPFFLGIQNVAKILIF